MRLKTQYFKLRNLFSFIVLMFLVNINSYSQTTKELLPVTYPVTGNFVLKYSGSWQYLNVDFWAKDLYGNKVFVTNHGFSLMRDYPIQLIIAEPEYIKLMQLHGRVISERKHF